MNLREPRAAAPADTVHLDSHALATLHYIRTSMESAKTLVVPGSAGIAMGSIGLTAAALSVSPGMHAHWLAIWLTSALIAATAGGALVIRPSSWRSLALAGTPVRTFILCLAPALLAGLVLTAVLSYGGHPAPIPGTWLLLYGCALISASAATTRTIGIMGASFMCLGIAAFMMPQHLQILLLGVGFGGLHIVFGFIVGRHGHGRQI
jgi:hypothetical protein